MVFGIAAAITIRGRPGLPLGRRAQTRVKGLSDGRQARAAPQRTTRRVDSRGTSRGGGSVTSGVAPSISDSTAVAAR